MSARRFLSTTVPGLAALALAASSWAGIPLSTTCQTPHGICNASVAPVGTPCACTGPRGTDAGRMSYVPGSRAARVGNTGITCRTQAGICQMPFQAQVGSPCTCFGPRGGDPGSVVR